MIRFISLLVSIPIIILVSAFAYKNADLVTVDLFLLKVDLPLVFLLLISLLLGVIIGFIFNIMALLHQKQKYIRLQSKKDALNGLSEVLEKPDK